MDVLAWLESLPIAYAIRTGVWTYALVSSLHIAGFCLLVGAAAMFDLRVLGVSKQIPISLMAKHLLPWARFGFILAVVAGFLMFITDPYSLAANPAFRFKLVLIGLAILNTVIFHVLVFRQRDTWQNASVPLAARVVAVFSLVLWFTTLGAGRFIAFV
jgi:predicted membrane protein